MGVRKITAISDYRLCFPLWIEIWPREIVSLLIRKTIVQAQCQMVMDTCTLCGRPVKRVGARVQLENARPPRQADALNAKFGSRVFRAAAFVKSGGR